MCPYGGNPHEFSETDNTDMFDITDNTILTTSPSPKSGDTEVEITPNGDQIKTEFTVMDIKLSVQGNDNVTVTITYVLANGTEIEVRTSLCFCWTDLSFTRTD